jgi:hypothetical protein
MSFPPKHKKYNSFSYVIGTKSLFFTLFTLDFRKLTMFMNITSPNTLTYAISGDRQEYDIKGLKPRLGGARPTP